MATWISVPGSGRPTVPDFSRPSGCMVIPPEASVSPYPSWRYTPMPA
ncbi:hypothetical protein SCANM63S_04679 [Streptomyces canarius]